MAVRKNLRQTQGTREKIQATKLVQRLQDHVDGKCMISATQMKAIEILLRKSLPDLSDLRIEGNVQPISFVFDLGEQE